MYTEEESPLLAVLYNRLFQVWNTSTEDSMSIVNLTMDDFKELARYHRNSNYQELLCKHYLPTVPQVYDALGGVGIALWILGTLISIILIVLCVKQAIFFCKHVHKMYDIHIFHITSIYVIMAVMTSIGTIIPRASGICSAAKDIYMAFGIGHFVELTLAMYGGERAMISHTEGRPIRVNRLPIFCCCFCIPVCATKGRSITILNWMVWQMKWSQCVYYLLRLIIRTSQEDTFGIVLPIDWIIYMNIGNVLSFLPGVLSLILIGKLVREDLQEKYNFDGKSRLLRLTIVTTKLQKIIFEILEVSGVFPCYPPLVSQKFYKNVIKDFIYLIESLILGFLTFWEYTKPNIFDTYEPVGVKSNIDKDEDSTTENGLSRNNLTEYQVRESMC